MDGTEREMEASWFELDGVRRDCHSDGEPGSWI